MLAKTGIISARTMPIRCDMPELNTLFCFRVRCKREREKDNQQYKAH